MNAMLQNVLKLQEIEFGNRAQESDAAALRAVIPQPILAHYERFRTRGKKGVAIVSNNTCAGCHMKVTLAKVAMLMRGNDIQLCDSCGRYLCLPPAPPPDAALLPAIKPARKPRKRKDLAVAA